MRLTFALGLVVFAVALGCASDVDVGGVQSELGGDGLAPGEVETLLTLPAGNRPEGVAVDYRGRGRIFVGNRIFGGGAIVNQILSVDEDGVSEVFATLPGSTAASQGVLGLATDHHGNVYAALASFNPATHGVYRISRDGGTVERLAGSAAIVFPNGLVFGRHQDLYVSDSSGSVWRYSDGAFAPWVSHPLLQPLPTNPFGAALPGANGIDFDYPDVVYVANTERSLIVRIEVADDGTAGTPTAITAPFALPTVDGIALDVSGNIQAVLPGFSLVGARPVVSVDTATGAVTPTVTSAAEAAKFDTPLSLVFGKGCNSRTLYVTNGDLPIAPGGAGPGVVRVGVEVRGSPH